MPNQYTHNASLTEQVRIHGEMLARLTVLVEEDHKDLGALSDAVGIIAKAMAAEETREAFKVRLIALIVPVLTSVGGILIGHFLMR